MGLFSNLFNKKKDTVPEPTPTQMPSTSNERFHMTIEDVFSIMGRGTVVTGRIDSGEVHVGDEVIINGTKNTTVIGIEMFRQTTDYAKTGDNCGIFLKGINREDVNKGDFLLK